MIIIPVHNQLEYLKICIESIKLNTKKFKLILIDDGSDKETKEWIENSGYKFIRNEIALGFTKACNIGIDEAMKLDFKCLCLLNSDTEIITNGWFDKVASFFEKDKIGIAGVVSDNAMCQSIKDIPKYLLNINNKNTFYSYLIHGFCYFINKNLLLEIGHLDDDLFPHYGSEDDYSLKSIKYGYKNIIIGSVFVKHNNCTSYGKKVRQVIIKKSMPDLIKRWKLPFIESCIKQCNIINKSLNE